MECGENKATKNGCLKPAPSTGSPEEPLSSDFPSLCNLEHIFPDSDLGNLHLKLTALNIWGLELQPHFSEMMKG